MDAGIPDFEYDSKILRARFGIPEAKGSKLGILETVCLELEIPIYILHV